MSSKVIALVAVMSAAGAFPVEAQIGQGRAGRANGTTAQARGDVGRQANRECESYGHEWDNRPFDRRDSRSRDRSCYGRDNSDRYDDDDRYDDRDDRRDGRIADRVDGGRDDDRRWNDAYHRNRRYDTRQHVQLHDRLDRMHDQWHRTHGWRGRDARWRRQHEDLHRRLERMHGQWHRNDRVGGPWRIR